VLKLVLLAAVILFAVAIAGHRVGPERQAAMVAEAASRTLAEVGRRGRRVTAAPGANG
jgi:Na+-transporting methylmalonyl-CoA/oxaloacetate decarboxylase gamma subunit